jgi:hypothetical protein
VKRRVLRSYVSKVCSYGAGVTGTPKEVGVCREGAVGICQSSYGLADCILDAAAAVTQFDCECLIVEERQVGMSYRVRTNSHTGSGTLPELLPGHQRQDGYLAVLAGPVIREATVTGNYKNARGDTARGEQWECDIGEVSKRIVEREGDGAGPAPYLGQRNNGNPAFGEGIEHLSEGGRRIGDDGTGIIE